MMEMEMIYGFRRGHSTYMAFLGMVEKIGLAWKNGDHSILIVKLELIRSYLSNREQYVVFESTHRGISVGVPQGSILGPLFFASSLFRYILFADDTNVFVSGKDKGNLLRGLNSEFGKLSDWFAHNRLTLN